MLDLQEQVVGCILGGAIGDGMGGPYDGCPGPVTLHSQAPWRISDDTQLTLATCEAIEGVGDVDPERVAECFATWFRDGRLTGLGASTRKALRDLDGGVPWQLSGCRGERAAGNGAAMRAAPLAFCLDPSDLNQRTILHDICRITHHNDEAFVGAIAIVTAIRIVTSDSWSPSDGLTLRVAKDLPDSRVRDALRAIAGVGATSSILELGRRFGCSGYVAESVPLAIAAAERIDELGLSSVLRAAIEAGGDTDTIASMAGQIAGAWLGKSRIDRDLSERLEASESVVSTAEELASRLGQD